LQYLTDAEIYSLPNPVSEALLKGLQRSNIWYRCNYSFAWFQATGTPIENKLADIYSITGFIDPGLLAPLWEFSYQHCYFDLQNENKITGYYNLQELKEKLKPVMIRREKKDVLDQLNSLTILDIPVEMHPVQADYHAMYARAVSAILSKKFKTPYDWQALTRNLQNMRMVCDSTFLVDKDTEYSPKLIELEEILLEKLDIKHNQRKIIIFSEWTTMLAMISRMLARNGIGFTELSGNIPVKDRKKVIREFEENPGCRVFLSSGSGGAGLNLQVADTVINFEPPWSPSKMNQRIGRIDRLGQKNPSLTVINLIMRDSIEMKVVSGLGVKQDLFDSVLNSDNDTDEVDFSEKGRAQFLRLLEESMGEFITGSPGSQTAAPPETPETQLPRLPDGVPLEELEEVMNKGMEFLSGLFRLSTGKELNPAGNRIEINPETGEVVMRFVVVTSF
ncbi:MAG: DEAD/DEAH box helicase, partial [Leadbetterella sp.]|nr:DEAD/DEAH box helicase [Leadbetterella sp.]